MLSALLAVVLAAGLSPYAGAHLVNYGDRKAVHIWSTDYYVTAAQPFVQTLGFDAVLDARAGQQVDVCVRSAHKSPGTLRISGDRFVEEAVEIPHGRRMRTRCATFTVKTTPQARPGRVEVEEGTYVTTDTARTVHGWVTRLSVRATV